VKKVLCFTPAFWSLALLSITGDNHLLDTSKLKVIEILDQKSAVFCFALHKDRS